MMMKRGRLTRSFFCTRMFVLFIMGDFYLQITSPLLPHVFPFIPATKNMEDGATEYILYRIPRAHPSPNLEASQERRSL